MISRSNTRVALRRKLGRGAYSSRLVCARKKRGVSTSCYEGSKLGDPLVFFLLFSFVFFSPSRFFYYPFFVYFDLSPGYPRREERKREGRRRTGKRIFRHYLRSPSRSILEEINGRNWSGSGSESCIYTFRPFFLSIQKNVIPSEASRGKQRTQWNPAPAEPIRSDRHELFDFGFRASSDLSGFARRRTRKCFRTLRILDSQED